MDMWRRMSIVVVSLCGPLAFSQGRFHFEPSLSTQFVHHIECKLEDKDPHQGLTFSPGLRLSFDLTKKLTLVASSVTKNMAGEVLYPVERVYSLNLKYAPCDPGSHRDRNRTRWKFIAETGIGYNVTDQRLEIPLYLGTAYEINPVLTWNTRVSMPGFWLHKDEHGTFRYASYGVDMGIAMRFCAVAPTRTRHGNPFILQ